ncbi:MAG: glycosyltransferase family 2 protein [Deltaproteobacteria bacterium]|nr:glycosyltransferase family 2 protein [Deltaproteobacteria bacterium]
MKTSDRRPVTAVVISFNESGRIAGCLESLAWADEIVVVDSGSADGTREIALRYTTKVFEVSWKGFGPQKQAAVARATHDMIFCLDCDERATPELAEEIEGVLRDGGAPPAFSVPRRTFLGSKEIRHSGWYPDRTVRLFDRRHARFSDQSVHERVIVSGATGRLKGHILHYSFDGFADILVKMNRYTDLSAREMFASGRRSRISDITLRPFLAFARSYLLRLGFLDGVEGLEIAAAAALHVFAKYAKLRELERNRPGTGH